MTKEIVGVTEVVFKTQINTLKHPKIQLDLIRAKTYAKCSECFCSYVPIKLVCVCKFWRAKKVGPSTQTKQKAEQTKAPRNITLILAEVQRECKRR